MQLIFCRKKLKSDRNYSAKYSDQNFLQHYGAQAIMQRLALLGITQGKALDIGSGSGLLASKLYNFDLTVTDSSQVLLQSNPCKNQINIDEEDLLLLMEENNLVTSCMSLHWINDIEQFLRNIYQSLKPGGTFIANFIGGKSLYALRRKLVELEIQLQLPSYPHVSPFITLQDATFLLQRAGFKQIISDADVLSVKYPNCMHAMGDLKKMGQSNKLLKSAGQIMPKSLYLALVNSKQEFVVEFEIITICGKKE